MNSQAQQLRGYVGNLMALVGASKTAPPVKRKSRTSEPKNRKASLTPVARRAKAAPSLPAGRELKPEQLIPLGGQEGAFKDF
jgi:hypothetical protein